MEDYSAADVIELDPSDVTPLPDDGVVAAADVRTDARDMVGAHPFLAVGAAMAAGYLFGRVIRMV